jgi:hypothetical protein
MKRPQNAWRPLLLGAVLMLVLVGVAGAVPTERPSALSAQKKLTITAADFYPCSHTEQYHNDGYTLRSEVDDDWVCFIAPVDFPTPRPVTVDKVQLHAADNNNQAQIILNLWRAAPSHASAAPMAAVSTGVEFADLSLHTWEDTTIGYNVKWPGHDTYLQAFIYDNDYLTLYGVTIYYRVGT